MMPLAKRSIPHFCIVLTSLYIVSPCRDTIAETTACEAASRGVIPDSPIQPLF